MTLGEHQEAFAVDLIALIHEAHRMGFKVRVGEVWRPQAMQDIYVAQGKSKTRNSQHTKKLAVDLYLFKDGKMATAAQIRPLGYWWQSLNPINRWGGSWGGLVEAGKSAFIDAPHFERKA
jgi:hypothetical protein